MIPPSKQPNNKPNLEEASGLADDLICLLEVSGKDIFLKRFCNALCFFQDDSLHCAKAAGRQ